MKAKNTTSQIADKPAEPTTRIVRNPLFECASPNLGRALRASDAEEAAYRFGRRLARQEYGPTGYVDKIKDAGYGLFYATVGRTYSGGFRGHQETLDINQK